ncbi:dTDP-4-dehydrorhamnose 3,5-epimerase [Nocardiopsis sediminis]|uniref:dTDP-4-dehydrorhamnose 3,5-epimerase n=1 Tax=Nocardiopsis sediminis TaxID=1778267 RepID=A0ABV8FS74_9ACTN
MNISEIDLVDNFLVTPKIIPDDRGYFLETFSQRAFQENFGHKLSVAQVNCSLSKRGTIRGMHAVALPGQARYVMCVQGAVTDIALDIRVGSPTFGRHQAVTLSAENRHALYLPEGMAHGFSPLTDEATVVYLCSAPWNPGAEFIINATDPELDLPWPEGHELLLSDKDRAAPSFREARERGLLPGYAACREVYDALAKSEEGAR